MYAVTHLFSLRTTYLNLSYTQIYSAAAATQHALHEGFCNLLDSQRHKRISPTSQYTALHVTISLPPLERTESFVARVLGHSIRNGDDFRSIFRSCITCKLFNISSRSTSICLFIKG